MLVPFGALFGLFVLYPVLRSLYLSFTFYNAVTEPRFVGLGNYLELFSDKAFLRAFWNTLVYALFTVSISTVLGLYLAFKLASPRWWNVILRSIFFLPMVSGSVAVINVWFLMFSSYKFGFVNNLLQRFGIAPQAFLDNSDWIMPILILIGIWGGTGLSMLLFLAGLRAIPHEVLEAAAIDGAGPAQRFWRITLPMLRPTSVYVTVTAGIAAFGLFNESYLLDQYTNRFDAVEAGTTLVAFLFRRGFTKFDLGLASSVAWVLFVLVFALSVINLRLGRFNEGNQ